MKSDVSTDVWQYREGMTFSSQGVDLTGYEVVARDGVVGTVDRASNDVRVNYIIVDTGDWHPGHQALLPAGTVERVDPSARKVFLDRTREQIRDAPDYDAHEKRSASFQDSLTGYYHGLYDTGL